MLWNAGVNWCAPVGVLWLAPSHNVKIQLLKLAANGTNVAIINRPFVYADDRGDLCPCSTEEDFFGCVQLGSINWPLSGNDAKFALRQLDDGITGDSQQDVFGGGRG